MRVIFTVLSFCFLLISSLFNVAHAAAIHDSTARGDIIAIEQALANGADIDERDHHGRAALHVAVLYGQTDSLGYLL